MSKESSAEEITSYTSGMIALIPSPESGIELLTNSGDELDQLHLTVCYLGEVSEIDEDTKNSIVSGVKDWATHYTQPFEAKVFGHAILNPDTDNAASVYLVNDSGEISLLENLFSVYSKSDYTPFLAHITAGYNLSESVNYIGPVVFDRIRVALGEEVQDIYLNGSAVKKESTVKASEWLLDDTSQVYTHIDFPFIAIVQEDEDPLEENSYRAYWDVMDSDTLEVLSFGYEKSVDEAQLTAEAAIASRRGTSKVESSTKHSWSFDSNTQSYFIEGEREEFPCTCGSRIAFSESVNSCPSCKESWYTWSVRDSQTDDVSRHFARTVLKRDGVILASLENKKSDYNFGNIPNVIENQYVIFAEGDFYELDGKLYEAVCVANGGSESYLMLQAADGTELEFNAEEIEGLQAKPSFDDLQFTSGFKYAKNHSFLPTKFTEGFKIGFISGLEFKKAALLKN